MGPQTERDNISYPDVIRTNKQTSGTDHRCSTNSATRPDGSWSWVIKIVVTGK